MRIAKTGLLVLGILATLIGLIWVGQGSGYFPYPAASFMIDQIAWVYRGAILALAGVIAIAASKRI